MKLKSILKIPAVQKVTDKLEADVSTALKNAAANSASAAMETKAGKTLKTAATNTALNAYSLYIIGSVIAVIIIVAFIAGKR